MWKCCFLSNVIFEKFREMTRNWGAHPAWLSNTTISRFPSTWLSHHTTSQYCYPCYGFLTPQFQILPTLHMEFFASVISTIVSNIAVLVSHSAIFFEYFMPMSHGANKKTPPSASFHLRLPYQVFTRFVCCKYFLLQAFVVFWFPRKLSSRLILAP